jgi:hypothetical protein
MENRNNKSYSQLLPLAHLRKAIEEKEKSLHFCGKILGENDNKHISIGSGIAEKNTHLLGVRIWVCVDKLLELFTRYPIWDGAFQGLCNPTMKFAIFDEVYHGD